MANDNWPWWPLLPLYPYGQRKTLCRELIPGQIWDLEQLQGVFYVAVPIRMFVVKIEGGLLLYGAVATTSACVELIRELELQHGAVCTIVHPTSSGLEHKVGVPPLARSFPGAQVWVTPGQWSFPIALPLPWLGFPSQRVKQLFVDGTPHPEQLDWFGLGPVPLGPGPFFEACCLHQASGSLLITDGLIAVSDLRPALLDNNPKPLLFHARENGEEPLLDTPEKRLKGWRRLVLFACYLRPAAVSQVFRLFPFRWHESWQQDFEQLSNGGALQVAPILEELVFPRHRSLMADWLLRCSELPIKWVLPAHFNAPVAVNSTTFTNLYTSWCTDSTDSSILNASNRDFLRSFNCKLEKLKLVPLA